MELPKGPSPAVNNASKAISEIADDETIVNILKTIASMKPTIIDYIKTNKNLPDNFLLFSVVEKLNMSVTAMQLFSESLLGNLIHSHKLEENVNAANALESINSICDELNSFIAILRDIATRMPPGPPHPHP